MKEDPKKLLNRLARDRSVAQHPLIQFDHLLGRQNSLFDEAQMLLPSEHGEQAEPWSFELAVLEDSHSVLRAARELNKCAADYIRNVRQKRCALIVLRSPKRLLAMGEWDLHARRWCQISEHSDEPVREEWGSMYQHMAKEEDLFPVRNVLPLPEFEAGTSLLQEVQEDLISVFSAEGSTDLDSLCNSSIFGMQPCFGWPSLLPNTCHPEACGALLLWTVASALSNDCELEGDIDEIVDRLLCKRADPDSMTDRGWNSLMFAVMAQKNTIVARLLEADADIDARAVLSGRTVLMLACSIQNFGLVCRLITAAASLDFAARIDGRTAILQAVEAGAWSIAEFLLQADADMNAPRFDGKTVLMLAVESNKLDLVEAIVNQRAELNLKDEKGASALSITLETKRAGPNQQDLLRILINGQCDVNTICPSRRLPAVTLAATAGNIEVVEALVQSQANINNVDPMSPVAAAARAEKWRAVQRLVELRADPDLCSTSNASIPTGNMKNENGNENAQATPALILAVKAGEQDLVRFLCSNGASPNLMDDTLSACGCAASANHLGILKLLAEVQADLDGYPKKGLAPLLIAAKLKRWPAFHLLLELGANPEVCEPCEGQTALIMAASQGNAKAVSSLIECRARMETRCNKGLTALIAAARQQSWMVVRRLAEARANLDAVESSDAKQSPKPVIVRLAETSQWDTLIHLARHGANLEVRGQAGRTVLMYAAECGLDDVAWWLLQCRADPNAEDERGETALLKACNRQLESFMRVLWEGGAGVEIPVQKSRIPAMARLLQKWNGHEDE